MRKVIKDRFGEENIELKIRFRQSTSSDLFAKILLGAIEPHLIEIVCNLEQLLKSHEDKDHG
jgi:hypothetical protein